MNRVSCRRWAHRLFSLLALILLLGIGAGWASADQFYLATGSNGIAGSLYLIDPATGAPVQTIGPLVDGLGRAYGLTGLAFQPGSNVLYGSTTHLSPTAPDHLVTINRFTALVTDIGSFGVVDTFADITFDRTTGILYGAHSAFDHWLYTINLATGAATKVGTGTRVDFGGAGLAANAAGAMFATPDGDTNLNPTLRTVDKTTGNETVVAALTGGPLPHIIDAMDFDSSGVLFGIQTTDGNLSPALTHLVKIDILTAVVTDVGPTVNDADALAILLSPTGAFQIRYAANLNIGDSVIDITNTGASSTVPLPIQDGNLCVNVYAFSPDEQLVSCCSCLLTPDGLVSLSVKNDLVSNTLTPGSPTSIVIKLLASSGGSSITSCNAGTVGTGTNLLASGLSAWGTTLHALPAPPNTYGATETPFVSATLSGAELTRITTLCSLIQANGSGFGICKVCRLGGQGSIKQ